MTVSLQTGALRVATFVIHPLVLGTKEFDKGMMTYQFDYGQPYTIPIYGWYLEGGDKRILVDTGEMRPILSESREAAIGGPIRTFADALAGFGLTPTDIDVVVHTHLHNDHCENDALCENAVFYVHERELAHASDPHPLDYRYNDEYIEDVRDGGQMISLTGDTDIVPGVRMVHTPAHTEGGMSVFVDTPAGSAVITGFCVIRENLFPPKAITAREMEVIPPGTCVNTYAAYDILRRIRQAADIVIPLHEPSFATGAPIGLK
jgi:glyoxylase-like metal-dependent hydrolase (beta-lactamase superfamily II)